MSSLNSEGNQYLIDTNDIKRSIQKYPNSVYFGGSIGFLKDPDFLVLDIIETVRSQIAIGLQKDSEFKGIFDYHVTKQIQSGLITYFIHKFVKDGRLEEIDELNVDPTEATDSLSYGNLLLPFLILGFGVVLCFIVCFIEYLRKSFSPSKVYHK